MTQDPELTIDALLASAQAHGEQSEPDMEIGDLICLCRTLWDRVPLQRRAECVKEFRANCGEWTPSTVDQPAQQRSHDDTNG
jgi:hypothetical protein